MKRNHLGFVLLAVLVSLSLTISATAIDELPAGAGSSASPVVFFETGDPAGDTAESDSDNGFSPDWSLIFHDLDLSGFDVPRGGGFGGDQSAESLDATPEMSFFLFVVFLIIGGAVYALVYSSQEDSEEDDDHEQDGDEGPGRATPDPISARLSVDDLENPIYQAWYEMVKRADIQAERMRTPQEIADMAVERGLPKKPVSEITTQFELVRYSRTQPTRDRVERTNEALQRVVETDDR